VRAAGSCLACNLHQQPAASTASRAAAARVRHTPVPTRTQNTPRRSYLTRTTTNIEFPGVKACLVGKRRLLLLLLLSVALPAGALLSSCMRRS
jgi:hypothetical protein